MNRLRVKDFDLGDEARGGHVVDFQVGVFGCEEEDVARIGRLVEGEGRDGVEDKVMAELGGKPCVREGCLWVVLVPR